MGSGENIMHHRIQLVRSGKHTGKIKIHKYEFQEN